MRWWTKRDSGEVWRVQAFWTVDGELRNYQPVYCVGRRAAEREAAEITRTLSHFPTLEVEIAPATAEAARTSPYSHFANPS
jgi:hypothetical protein